MSVLARATDDEFTAAAQQYRRELLAHCYRMTGSLHDAEDLVQETYVRGWKSYGSFRGQSSLRTWLYRIATNVCLTALEGRARRPLPIGLGAPHSDPAAELQTDAHVPWLEPLPDDAADPSTIAGSRESVRLAFVAALQLLSARQRAVLVLREVLQWRAAEVADTLGTSTAAVNSLLQRARSQLATVRPSAEDRYRAPQSPMVAERLARYIAAFEAYDIDALVTMFTADAIWEMPPFTGWYRGPQSIGALIRLRCPAGAAGDMRLVATSANGQPAAAMYMRDTAGGDHLPFQLHVLELDVDGVAHVVAFNSPGLFARFGLPERLTLGR